MHRRLVDNPVYDEINMGTQNFVIATFNQLLLRYPTENELAQSSLMIEGFNGILFFEPGKSKDDYLTIFTESNDYFEGQVRDVYLRYLFREPLSHEVTTYAEQYKTSDDYSALLKVVLGSDEYAGI